MSEFSITINPNADVNLFDFWLRVEYPEKYQGWVLRDDKSYILLLSTEPFSISERNAITAYYNGLTEDNKITDKYCRIYRHLPEELANSFGDWSLPPLSVDYIRQTNSRLNSLVTGVYKGEVREITYFEELNTNQYEQLEGSVPVIRETFDYIRNDAKMVVSRVMRIYWYRCDGSLPDVYKQRDKFYTPEESIKEAQTLRRNIIDFMQPDIIAFLMQTESLSYNDAITMGAELSNKHSSLISSWIFSARNNPLMSVVQEEDEIFWLDNVIDEQGTTIRDYIYDQLNY